MNQLRTWMPSASQERFLRAEQVKETLLIADAPGAGLTTALIMDALRYKSPVLVGRDFHEARGLLTAAAEMLGDQACARNMLLHVDAITLRFSAISDVGRFRGMPIDWLGFDDLHYQPTQEPYSRAISTFPRAEIRASINLYHETPGWIRDRWALDRGCVRLGVSDNPHLPKGFKERLEAYP